MRVILLFIFLNLCQITGFSTLLSLDEPGKDEVKGIITDLGSIPSTIVGGCVNVISGNFIDHETDLVIPGPEDLNFARSYCSNDTSNSPFFRHWQHNHQGALSFSAVFKGLFTEASATFQGDFGARSWYSLCSSGNPLDFECLPSSNMYASGLTNVSQRFISGQNNIKNSRLYFKCSNTANCLFADGSGEVQEYESLEVVKKPNIKLEKDKQYNNFYRLKLIQKPSGMSLEYHYKDKFNLKNVIVKNRSDQPVGHFTFTKFGEKEKNKFIYRVETPEGRFAQYELAKFGKKDSLTLQSVNRSDAPNVTYKYEDAEYDSSKLILKGHVERINRKNKPDGRFVGVEYYKTGDNIIVGKKISIDSRQSPVYNRVRKILAPCGPDETPIDLYTFDYCVGPLLPQWGTGVYDALGNKTDYFFNHENRLQYILKFTDSGKTAYTKEEIFWWDAGDSPEATMIKTRCLAPYGSENKIYAQNYFYDSAGNVKTEVLFGNIRGVSNTPLVVDTSGNVVSIGPDHKSKECAYSEDGRNLLIESKEGELRQSFTYSPGTNLMTACLYWNLNGVYKRSFFEYDENAQVVKAISDDGILLESHDLTGVTLRSIEYTKRSSTYPFGLPIEVKKVVYDVQTGSEVVVGKEENRFDGCGRLVEKKVYDSNNCFAYVLNWTYDAHGNVLTETNPLGHMISRDYDANDNLIKEVGPTPDNIKTFVYDYSNRLIQKNEHHPDGTLSQHFVYDFMSNKIAAIDVFGQQTDYTYDAFSRVTSEKGPPLLVDGQMKRPTTIFSYDELNNPIAITDAQGVTVKTAYTIFGKPYKKEYPDGSVEAFEYDLDSRCVKSIAKNGSTTFNTYDYQGRLIQEEIRAASGETMSVKEWAYSRSQLQYEKDPMGNITEYGYDAYGRECSISRGDSHILKEYDSFGRLCKTIQGDSVKIIAYDLLNQVIEEREEYVSGNALKEMSYAYDAFGNRAIVKDGTGAITQTTYDSHGVPAKIVDPEGNITQTKGDYCFRNTLGQVVLKLETIDPLGNKTVIINDTLARASQETTYSSYGEVLHDKSYSYDLGGNCTQVIETPYANGQALEPRIFAFEYDTSKHILKFTQAACSSIERSTYYSYNLSGEKITTVKPDGTTLHYSYDALGRLADHFDETRTFHYRYYYDANNNPIRTDDLIKELKTNREFDSFNCMKSESLPHGLKVDFTYDPFGKLIKLILPDQTAISYCYQGSILKTIDRHMRDGTVNYSHQYNQYDLSGKILEEKTIFNGSKLTYGYSLCGNLIKSSSPFFTEEEMQYDAKGNLLKRNFKDSLGVLNESYQYDNLGQLEKEDGIQSNTYTYDSLNNRLSQNDVPNSINLLNQLLEDEKYAYTYDLSGNLIQKNDTTYTYDSLDRLIQIQTDEHVFKYTYDELNRCMTIKQNNDEIQHLIYLNQAEIGSCSSSGELNELQILGLGRKTEPCAAVAIELKNTAYAVYRDQTGHIRALVNSKGEVAESYRYSSFGLMETYSAGQSLNNPWTVAGKRYQPETGLALFGYRFYCPETGRWITQDPAGLTAGPNLYAYLHNSPLVHYDAFGLYEDFDFCDMNAYRSYERGPVVLYWDNFEKNNSHAWYPNFCPYFYENSRCFDLSDEGRPSLPSNMGIGFINGIWNDFGGSKESALYISDMADGYNINTVFNATHGRVTDVEEYHLGSCYIATEPVRQLHKMWNAFFENSSSNSQYLMICHSQGATHTRNALLDYPDELRKRIHVVAIAPGSYIYGDTCASVFHYRAAWWRDFVPRFDKSGARREKSSVFTLDSHEQASLFDHEFKSPTYTAAIKHHVKKFIRSNGTKV